MRAAPCRRFVLTWLSTAAGGAERSVLELATALSTAGHTACVVWWNARSGEENAKTHGRVILHQVARVEAAARTALFQAILVGGLDHIRTNPLFDEHRHGITPS